MLLQIAFSMELAAYWAWTIFAWDHQHSEDCPFTVPFKLESFRSLSNWASVCRAKRLPLDRSLAIAAGEPLAAEHFGVGHLAASIVGRELFIRANGNGSLLASADDWRTLAATFLGHAAVRKHLPQGFLPGLRRFDPQAERLATER